MKNCIAKIRKESGLTLQALADRVGASNQQISHLEKERRGLTVDWLERIAIALDSHPFDLLVPDASLMKIDGTSLTAIEQQEATLGLLRTVVCRGKTPTVQVNRQRDRIAVPNPRPDSPS